MNSSPYSYAADIARSNPAALPDKLEWLPHTLCNWRTTKPRQYRRLRELREAIQTAATEPDSPALRGLVREFCDICRDSPLPA